MLLSVIEAWPQGPTAFPFLLPCYATLFYSPSLQMTCKSFRSASRPHDQTNIIIVLNNNNCAQTNIIIIIIIIIIIMILYIVP